MRFLLDENLPVRLVDVLRSLGHDAKHVKPLGLATAADARLWSYAVQTARSW